MLALDRLEAGFWIPGALEPSWEYTPVQRHTDDIVLLDPIVEDALHQAVRAQRSLDVTLYISKG